MLNKYQILFFCVLLGCQNKSNNNSQGNKDEQKSTPIDSTNSHFVKIILRDSVEYPDNETCIGTLIVGKINFNISQCMKKGHEVVIDLKNMKVNLHKTQIDDMSNRFVVFQEKENLIWKEKKMDVFGPQDIYFKFGGKQFSLNGIITRITSSYIQIIDPFKKNIYIYDIKDEKFITINPMFSQNFENINYLSKDSIIIDSVKKKGIVISLVRPIDNGKGVIVSNLNKRYVFNSEKIQSYSRTKYIGRNWNCLFFIIDDSLIMKLDMSSGSCQTLINIQANSRYFIFDNCGVIIDMQLLESLKYDKSIVRLYSLE